MPNNPSQVVTNAATIVSVISAAAAIISAFLSFISFRKSSAQFESTQKENFINQSNEKLDKVYIDLNKFVQTYTGSRDTKEKRVVRDRIVFSLDSLRVDFSSNKLTDNQIDTHFGDLSLKISDTTYEKNFEKNMNDLTIIKNSISALKSMLFALG
jgi:hypothetical protein